MENVYFLLPGKEEKGGGGEGFCEYSRYFSWKKSEI